MNKEVINALRDIKRQITVEGWAIPSNDRGSGSAGVRLLTDEESINAYLDFAEHGDNSHVPQCEDIDYISSDCFGEDENEIISEMMDYCADFVEREDVIGLVVCHEHYDMDYTYYIAHLAE